MSLDFNYSEFQTLPNVIDFTILLCIFKSHSYSLEVINEPLMMQITLPIQKNIFMGMRS